MIDIELVRFLLENHRILLVEPILGCCYTIHSLFNSKSIKNRMSYDLFIVQLNKIKSLDKYSIEFENDVITFINSLNLEILLEKLDPKPPSTQPVDTKIQYNSPLDQLQSLLSPMENPNLTKLSSLLKYESSTVQLSREKLRYTTPKSPFIEICNNPQHLQYHKSFDHCFQTKIHFIPIITNQTDPSLGDCSYLDTCHKMDSCRYVHYTKHIPKNFAQNEEQICNSFNNQLLNNEKISYWNINGSISTTSRCQLSPQWINCDVRKFDFTILGQFAAVIADPAWNIHMNLPYGTCNDTELNSLPLSSIQEEGIICLWVTGRTIEIGKKALSNWGYKVQNEIIWIKTNQLGRTICTGRTGHWLNHSKEHLIVGVKGTPKWLNKNIEGDVLVSGTRETSRKPDELYGMVERLVGPHARKLEIFGRDHNTRPGWFTIGNQLKGNQIVEYDVLERYNASINK